jgi:DNA polymerase I
VKVLYTRRGISDTVLADEEWITEKYGITPAQYVEYAALRGDNSDNLPGVPGVGEKTAAKLISEYGNIDGVFGAVATRPRNCGRTWPPTATRCSSTGS